MGLRERILKAASVEDIHVLLAEGDKYEYAMKRTRKSWEHAALRRGRELTKSDLKIKVVEKSQIESKLEQRIRSIRRISSQINKVCRVTTDSP